MSKTIFKNKKVLTNDCLMETNNKSVLLNLIVIELKEYFRNSQAAFWTFIYPMAIVFFLMLAFGDTSVEGGVGGINYGAYLICGMLAINILSMGFFGFGVSFIEARNRGSFKMYQIFPVWKFSYIFSFVFSRVLIVAAFSLVFLIVNDLLYSLELSFSAAKLIKILAVVFCAALAFIALTFLLVSFMSKAATATAVLNILFYPIMIFSDLFIPQEAMMEELSWLGSFSPVNSVAVSFRDILINDAALSAQTQTFSVLLAITIVSLLLSLKTFKFRR